jgi:hypothetical protein
MGHSAAAAAAAAAAAGASGGSDTSKSDGMTAVAVGGCRCGWQQCCRLAGCFCWGCWGMSFACGFLEVGDACYSFCYCSFVEVSCLLWGRHGCL